VFGQPEKLHRVISNILGNAIKFSPLQSYIMVNLKKEGSCAVITIADQGIGIPGEKQPYIFDRFTSASLPGTSGEQSLGLGLSICKEIVEEHNGTIHFQSTKGKGTTFYVQLPIS
jgi:signal transduction histidine kinase